MAGAAAKPANGLGRLHQIALKATDLEASVAFYRDVLGLPLIARFDPPGLAFFDLDGTRLMLSANSIRGDALFRGRRYPFEGDTSCRRSASASSSSRP